MKTKKSHIVILLLFVFVTATVLGLVLAFKTIPEKPLSKTPELKGCVFKTLFGEEPSDSNFIYKTPAKTQRSIETALEWVAKAQLADGGWGSGTHAHQDIMNPLTVESDPASTAMVAMALLRCDNTPASGKFSSNLNRAIKYLLNAVENSGNNNEPITSQTGTQPQIKLGSNIDVILTSQFLTNLLHELDNNPDLKARVKKCNDKCVAKIQKSQERDGSFKGSGWAGVLQSSLATNALETARENGIEVDTVILENSKTFQKGNYDAKNGNVKTSLGAGVMLYSLSGSSRASAKEAKVAKEKIYRAKEEGKLAKDDQVNSENLKKIGLSAADANKYYAAYEVNVASKIRAQQGDVMEGFGSNGGEEFLSYLQTGEGMIISRDTEWKKWYDNMSGRLLKIQNPDGSWNGHHCITSPVFVPPPVY